jgi:hypothetical protein
VPAKLYYRLNLPQLAALLLRHDQASPVADHGLKLDVRHNPDLQPHAGTQGRLHQPRLRRIPVPGRPGARPLTPPAAPTGPPLRTASTPGISGVAATHSPHS